MARDRIFVRPAKGLLVRDPASRLPLAEAGEFKPKNSYWVRRLADGDVEETKPARPGGTAKPGKD